MAERKGKSPEEIIEDAVLSVVGGPDTPIFRERLRKTLKDAVGDPDALRELCDPEVLIQRINKSKENK